MKIALAQLKPVKGDIEKNIDLHLTLVDRAVTQGANAIFFPELSITAYEPALANELCTTVDDARFTVFQAKSNEHDITIGIGVPIAGENKPHIGMLIFQPSQNCICYFKQLLHEDELPFFASGDQQLIVEIGPLKIAPAICYESLQSSHIQEAVKLGANLYLASVAKSQDGIDRANLYFSQIARTYNIPVFMSNSVGYCDNFESAGQTAVWNRNGKCITRLRAQEEGLIIRPAT